MFLNKCKLAGVVIISIGLAVIPKTNAHAYPGPDQYCPAGWNTRYGVCADRPENAGYNDKGFGPQGGRLDAHCQATGRFDYCQWAAYIGCNYNRLQNACNLLSLSQQRPDIFLRITWNQKACLLDGNQRACHENEYFRNQFGL
jgi:hypothetical protein